MKDKIKSLQERLLPRILSQAGGGELVFLSLLFICKYDIKRCIRIFCFYCVSVVQQQQQRSAERVDYHHRLDLPKRRLLWVIINLRVYV